MPAGMAVSRKPVLYVETKIICPFQLSLQKTRKKIVMFSVRNPGLSSQGTEEPYKQSNHPGTRTNGSEQTCAVNWKSEEKHQWE